MHVISSQTAEFTCIALHQMRVNPQSWVFAQLLAGLRT